MPARSSTTLTGFLLGLAVTLSAAPHTAAYDSERFPAVSPANRAEALALVGGDDATGCLTPRLETLAASPTRATGPAGRVIPLLQNDGRGGSYRTWSSDGVSVRVESQLLAGVEASPLPGPVRAAMEGIRRARRDLVVRLGLAAPEVDVHLVQMGATAGYTVAAAPPATSTVVIDISPHRDSSDIRRSSVHQYAHAVAREADLDPSWAEALATWAEIRSESAIAEDTRLALNHRVERLDEGLFDAGLELAPGNALWLEFIDRFYGPTAVRLGLEGLGESDVSTEAFSRALARVSDDDLQAAFGEFQLWALMTGSRADTHHFSFAARLDGARFSSDVEGLPALSVQADPPVAPWGASWVRLEPQAPQVHGGGLAVHFDGGLDGHWDAELILFVEGDVPRRVDLPIEADGRGYVTVPLSGVTEAILMIRNLGGEPAVGRRYTYAADVERHWPFELVSLEAQFASADGGGIAVSWETASERDLVGFNVVRSREDGGAEVVTNPVWIPALGDPANATHYGFLDSSAEPGVHYAYRIDGITTIGLASRSETVVAKPAD